jgi:hypothetical protein
VIGNMNKQKDNVTKVLEGLKDKVKPCPLCGKMIIQMENGKWLHLEEDEKATAEDGWSDETIRRFERRSRRKI